MRPFVSTVQANAGGVRVGNACVLSNYNTPSSIAVGVITSGAIYTVQHTYDDPFTINLNSSVSAANWIDNPTLVSANRNLDAVYTSPPTAIRLRLNAGSGDATMTVIQTGP